MRLALLLLVLVPTVARAQSDDAPVPKPMTPVTNSDFVCGMLTKDLDPKLACKDVAHVKLADGATVDLWAVKGDLVRYAVVVEGADHKHAVSAPVELTGQDCGMMKCDMLDGATPKLRTIQKGKIAVLELTAKFHHEVHEPKMAVTERWQEVDYLACGPASGGALTCVARHFGGRGHSCKGKLADDGALSLSCDDLEQLSLD